MPGALPKSSVAANLFRDYSSYWPAIMWFWNDLITEAGIEQQLNAFARAGVKEFYVHPLWGIELDYLSPRFFELIQYTVIVAGKLGLSFSIYDEYNWPSGAAGGYLLKREPWTKGKKLVCISFPLYAGQPLCRVLPGQLVSAQIIHGDSRHLVEDITDTINQQPEINGIRIQYLNRSCSGSILSLCYAAIADGLPTTGMWSSFSWFETGTLDTNNPNAVRRFIEYTHEQYKQAIGCEFGKTVRGVFTDEASTLLMFDRIDAPGVFPWTDNLAKAFELDHGYRLLPCLYALSSGGTSDPELKIRYDYWKTVSKLFCDSYMRQTSAWCRENQLISTGHLSGEGVLFWHAFQMGDFYTSLSELDIPGIDNILSNLYVDDPLFGVEAKLVSSLAKFNNQSRVMCETFSGSGWDMTISQMKRIVNRLVMMGINYFIFMGAYYSLDGSRKHIPMGYPPSHGYNNPLFKHYPLLCSYTAKLCALSAATRPAGQVLLLLPQVTQYMDAENMGGHDVAWKAATECLIGDSIEFDIFFEQLAIEVIVKEKTLLLRGYVYDTLIVPGAAYLDEATATMIEKYASTGGKILFINSIPKKAVDSGRKLDLFDEVIPFSDASFYSLQGSRSTYCSFDRHNQEAFNAFRQFLHLFTDADLRLVRIDQPQNGLCVAHRESDQMHVFLVANDTDQPITTRLAIKSCGSLILIQPETETCLLLPQAHPNKPRLVDLVLPGHDLQIIMSNPDIEDITKSNLLPTDMDQPATSVKIELNNAYTFTASGGNLLPLKLQLVEKQNECLLQVDQYGLKAVAWQLAETSKIGGMPQELPGSSGIGFGDRYLAIAHFRTACPFDDFLLRLEYESNMLVYLDGNLLQSFHPCLSWGVRGFYTDIAKIVLSGEHLLIIIGCVPPFAAPHSIPTAYLQGSFCVVEDDLLTSPCSWLEPKAWNAQGYPYFCGDGIYETTFSIDQEFKSLILQLDTTDIVVVYVNDLSVGCAAWQPYSFNITSAVQQGENNLRLVFTSTYARFMEMTNITLVRQGFAEYAENKQSRSSGLLAPVRLLIVH